MGFIPYPESVTPPETMVDTAMNDQDGLAVAPHPFSYRCPSLGTMINELFLDGVEVLNAAHRDIYVNGLAQKSASSSLAHTGGSDAHSPEMLGDAFTEFEGKSADDLYRSIQQGETNPGGGPAPLRHWILWNMEIAHGVGKRLIASFRGVEHTPDDPLERVYQMRRHNKVIALGACMAFMATPLPFVCGIIGEGWIRWKGRKKLKEVSSEWISGCV